MGETSTGKSSGGSADSYIGSLISLTSKYEIRYEGILYNINTDESSIGLRNVRSFGTEGRKKDGPQIPPSDKIYEYILFRGTDIKDLQVKSSPSVQATPPIYNDPAIIQSHYSHPAPLSKSMGSSGSSAGAESADIRSHGTHLTGHAFQGGMPLYQPGGAVGSWGSTTPPNPNGSGLAMPMYWQGFYGPSSGLPHLQQQPIPLRPPPGLAIPQSAQQQLSYLGVNAPSQMSSTLPEVSLPSVPVVPPVSSTSLTMPLTLAPTQVTLVTSEPSPSLILNKVPSLSVSSSGASTSLPLASFISSTQEISAIVTPMPTKAKPVSVPNVSYPTVSQSVSSVMGTSSSVHADNPVPALITPNQLQPFQKVQRDVEVVVSSSPSTTVTKESQALVPTDVKAPLLPLPKPSDKRMNGRGRVSHVSRGRGRGRGPEGRAASHVATRFTEDFDFMAMNEKFNKDEVWGHLGKTQSQKNKASNLDDHDDEDFDEEEEGDADHSKIEMKPVYVKDDFFDSISCNALEQESRNGRTKFSEQMKLDTETFGNFSRYRGGRGGPGAGRRGSFRGAYYGGRGFGYGGRGRGHMTSSRGRH